MNKFLPYCESRKTSFRSLSASGNLFSLPDNDLYPAAAKPICDIKLVSISY